MDPSTTTSVTRQHPVQPILQTDGLSCHQSFLKQVVCTQPKQDPDLDLDLVSDSDFAADPGTNSARIIVKSWLRTKIGIGS